MTAVEAGESATIEAGIIATMHDYAEGVDSRDWVDTLRGAINGFDVTQHYLSNFRMAH